MMTGTAAAILQSRGRVKKITEIPALIFWDCKTDTSSCPSPDFLFCETKESPLLWIAVHHIFCDLWLVIFWYSTFEQHVALTCEFSQIFSIDSSSAKNSLFQGKCKLLNPHPHLKYILFISWYLLDTTIGHPFTFDFSLLMHCTLQY